MSKATKERVSRTSTENEAKALSEELANLLVDKSPWNPDVVFAREKCVYSIRGLPLKLVRTRLS